MVIGDTGMLALGAAALRVRSRRLKTIAVAGLAVAFAALLICTAPARARGCAHAGARVAGTSRSVLEEAVVCLINQQRRSRHLPRLSADARLNRSAQGWTNVMVSRRYFGHGADFSARISAVGFVWSSVGENIATGFATPARVVRAWMSSAGHCQNILTPTYREVGTGVLNRAIAGASSSPGTWTQDFALLMGQHPASGNWGPADGCPYG